MVTEARTITPKLGFQGLAADTTQKHDLGAEMLVKDDDGNAYWVVYVVAGGAITAGYACIVDEDFSAVQMTTTNAGAVPQGVVIPQFDLASGEWGWAVCGPGTGFEFFGGANCAKDVPLYTTATAGLIDDAATTLVEGLRTDTLVGGSNALTPGTAATRLSVNTADV